MLKIDYLSILIYFFSIFVSVCLYIYIEKTINKKGITGLKKIILLLLSMIPLIILFTIRKNVGTDYKSYLGYFNVLKATPFNYKLLINYFLEPGWVIISYIIICLKLPYTIFLLIISLIFSTFIILVVNKLKSKYSKILFLVSSYVIIFIPFFNITRQELASIIAIYALLLLLEKKDLKFFLLILFASLFHKSVLITLIFPIFKLIVKDNKKFLFIIILLILSPLWGTILGKFLLILFEQFNLTTGYFRYNPNLSYGFILYTLPLLLLLFYVFIKNNNVYNNFQIKILSLIYLLILPFQTIGNYILMVDRLSVYFNNFQIILFPILLNYLDKELQKKIFILLILWYIIYFIIMYALLNAGEVMPYQTILIY